MNELIESMLKDASDKMKKVEESFLYQMTQIRSGRASASLVDDIKVDMYGQLMPLKQLANVNIPEARQILINVWDKSALEPIEKAILKSGKNFTPQIQGNSLRINLPELTEENRKEFVKLAKQKTEEHKVSIRNVRRDINEEFKKLKNEGISEDELHAAQEKTQNITDQFILNLDTIFEKKQKEIMTI